jgi:hypothetical protein
MIILVSHIKTFLKLNTPPNTYLSVDLGSWISNAKVLVPVSKLIKIPSQKVKLLKAIEGSNEQSLGSIRGKLLRRIKNIMMMPLLFYIVWIGQRKITHLSLYL